MDIKKENNKSILNDINSLFHFKEKSIWIYGAGFMGRQLEVDLMNLLDVSVKGFVDQNAKNNQYKDYKIIQLEDYFHEEKKKSDKNYILIASRHWEEISKSLIGLGLNEPQDFIKVGLYCESYSPLELDWYFDKHYYDPFYSIRKNGKADIDSGFNENALYDYFSSRHGNLTLKEGKYLENSVVSTKSKKILELGSNRGKSTLFLAKGVIENGDGFVTAVDTFGWKGVDLEKKLEISYGKPFYNEFIQNISFNAEYKSIIKPQMMKYQDFLMNNTVLYDFVFIDLFHTYDEIINVFNNLQSHIEKGAQVLFHDYSEGWPGEVKAINELIKRKLLELISFDIPGSLIHCRYIKSQK